MAELMRRVFLLPDTSLFQSEFKSKSEVFMAISDTSNSYHMTSDSLKSGIDYFFKAKLNVKSDRLPNKPLVLLNNRWRHTQLTQAV
ncbi:hypothetical protein EA860_26520, partial [Vibrio anguillarum]|nr:hypothetical protein [Vibrio anguillarum]